MTDFVIFGATGDLAARKLYPALYELAHARHLGQEVRLVGVGRKPWTPEDFVKHVRESLEKFKDHAIPSEVDDLVKTATYIQMDFSPESFQTLAAASSESSIFFLSLPPDAFPVLATGLGQVGLADESKGFRRLVIEKPFGNNLKSAIELQETLMQNWKEHQIYRIDHFLGKEMVQNILVFRFANSWLEPLWNNHHIAQVQITAAESIGIEGRGAFYDGVGAIRDMVQNHLLQLLTLSTMEPPPRLEANLLRNEKTKVLRAARDITSVDVVRGQYEGYREEAGNPDSNTETFAAVRMYLDNWRWKGVPFYIRTGKGMAAKKTTIALQFKDAPNQLFAKAEGHHGEGWIELELQPHESMHLEMQVKTPGLSLDTRTVNLTTPYKYDSDTDLSAYATLILDTLRGDASNYIRYDEVEWAWRLIDPILETSKTSELYAIGSDGPAGQDALLEPGHKWRKLK